MNSPYENGGSFKVTSPIGYRQNPITGANNSPHYGLDIVGQDNKNIVSLKSGKVLRSRIAPYSTTDLTYQWGNYVSILGDDGYTIFYCHLQERLVSQGETVEAGRVIGVEGATGQVTGRHCHLEKRRGTRQCNLNDVDSDNCNIAHDIGITNLTGYYKKDETVVKNVPIVEDIPPAVSVPPIVHVAFVPPVENIKDDNEPAEWAREAVEWAADKSNDILFGDQYGNYKLSKECTRQETMIFLNRLRKLME